MSDISEEEKQINEYLQKNNTQAAVQLLFELVAKNAREKKFARAEALRDRIFQVDSMALTEIVKSGETIEAEKNDAIDREHLELWSDLYGKLTPEETNALYYTMKPVKYPPNHMVFRQGEICSRLLFVDEGRLKMFYRQADKAILLKVLHAGDIAGEDDFFFSDVFCTTSLITDSKVKIRVLDKEELEKMREKTPGLESKLNDYCLQLESINDLLKAKKLERRVQRRVNVPGKALVQIVDRKNQPLAKPFKGELLDISSSGVAFIIKTTEKSSRLLLGRKLNMQFGFAELSSDIEADRIGTVVAVNCEPFNEYIIHVEFDKQLDPTIVDELEALTKTDGT